MYSPKIEKHLQEVEVEVRMSWRTQNFQWVLLIQV